MTYSSSVFCEPVVTLYTCQSIALTAATVDSTVRFALVDDFAPKLAEMSAVPGLDATRRVVPDGLITRLLPEA